MGLQVGNIRVFNMQALTVSGVGGLDQDVGGRKTAGSGQDAGNNPGIQW